MSKLLPKILLVFSWSFWRQTQACGPAGTSGAMIGVRRITDPMLENVLDNLSAQETPNSIFPFESYDQLSMILKKIKTHYKHRPNFNPSVDIEKFSKNQFKQFWKSLFAEDSVFDPLKNHLKMYKDFIRDDFVNFWSRSYKIVNEAERDSRNENEYLENLIRSDLQKMWLFFKKEVTEYSLKSVKIKEKFGEILSKVFSIIVLISQADVSPQIYP